MLDVVVDSSVVVKWFLPEPDSVLADSVINDTVGQGGKVIVLDLALAEVANAIWKRHYRGLTTLEEARQSLDDLLAAPLTIESTRPLLRAALEIAAKYRRTIYDSAFVALSQHL